MPPGSGSVTIDSQKYGPDSACTLRKNLNISSLNEIAFSDERVAQRHMGRIRIPISLFMGYRR